MQDRVGQRFGSYRLLKLLGKGGFAEVYLGEHVLLQSKAAVKVLHGTLATSDAQGFLREARTLAALEHPNIVGIKEFAVEHGVPFLVMNYASKGTLRQRHPKGQRVPLEAVVSYVQQVADALQYAHSRHIVHCDLKPENMLIANNGNLLLSDFGIAVLYSPTHSYVPNAGAGTYAYMAPEQITGKALPASDQYALGITVYEWLCGEVPFIGLPTQITAKHLHVPPPPLRDKGITIAPQVEAVIRRALEKDLRQRFASVQEFALALQRSCQAQQHNSMHAPGTISKDSIFIATPNNFTSGHTHNSSQSRPSVDPRSTSRTASPDHSHHSSRNTPPTQSYHSSHNIPSNHSQHTSSTKYSDNMSTRISPTQQTHTIYPYTPPIAPTQRAPRSTGSKWWAITLISVGLILVIGFFVVLINLGKGPSSATNTPETLIDSFCRDLTMKNYQSAYDMYSSHLQNQISFNDFRNQWSANNKGDYEIDRCDHQTIPTPSSNSITASWSIHDFFGSPVQSYNVTFVIQGNEWKIDQIDSTTSSTTNTPSATDTPPIVNNPSVNNTPETLIDSFCHDLTMNNYQSAYDMYSNNLQNQVTFTAFENYWSGNNKGAYKIDRCDHQTIPTPSSNSITASWSTHEFFSSQVQQYSVTFVIQGSEWKIDQITSV